MTSKVSDAMIAAAIPIVDQGHETREQFVTEIYLAMKAKEESADQSFDPIAECGYATRIPDQSPADEVERVARAIWRNSFQGEWDEAEIDCQWNKWPDEQKTARSQAHAAIAALSAIRNGDEGMQLREALKQIMATLDDNSRSLDVINDRAHSIAQNALDATKRGGE